MVLVKNISNKTILIKSDKLDPGKFVLLLDKEFAEISDRLNKLERSSIVKIELEQWYIPKDVSPTEKIEQSDIHQEKPSRPAYVEEAEPPEPQDISDPSPVEREADVDIHQEKPSRPTYVEEAEPPEPQEIWDPEPQTRHSDTIVYQDKPKRKQYRKRRPPNPLK